MSWKCKCGLINNGLNLSCTGKNQSIINCSTHEPVTPNYYDDLQAILVRRAVRAIGNLLGQNYMDANEELFKKFFNHELGLIKDMDNTTLRSHREEMAMIAFEARARLQANDHEERERHAKLRQSERDWIRPIGVPDPNVSDAIKTVEKRKERMSKAEKFEENMKALGISDDKRAEMLKLMQKSTEKEVSKFNFNAVTEKEKQKQPESKPIPVESQTKPEIKPFF